MKEGDCPSMAELDAPVDGEMPKTEKFDVALKATDNEVPKIDPPDLVVDVPKTDPPD